MTGISKTSFRSFLATGFMVLAFCSLAVVSGVFVSYPLAKLVVSSCLICGAFLTMAHLYWSMVEPIDETNEAGDDAVFSAELAPIQKAIGAKESQPLKSNTLSRTDEATGLGNKERFKEKFNNLAHHNFQSTDREAVRFSIGAMNIDGMKVVNDLYGEREGDVLIAQCASRLRAALDGKGFVYRRGGDEFAFLLPEIKTSQEVEHIGKLLQEITAAPFDIHGLPVRITTTLGFAIYPESGSSFEKISSALDTALYHSKRKGPGGLTLFSEEVATQVREDALLEQALRRAIANEQIKPHFQPIISLQDGRLMGFEALARWVDPDHGSVSPARFVPLAEERLIIGQLTESLLVQAAKAASQWPADLFLSFNLSGAQLAGPDTATEILAIIRKVGLSPGRLEIEVTETAIMSDPKTAAGILEELHLAGVRIAMDDFGTGQSSLGRLRELKLDKVKIDRVFVTMLEHDRPAQHIVRAILEMCAGLDLIVVAEGIEEIGQAEMLREFGCHAGQGYLFGKAQDAIGTMGYIREFRRVSEMELETKVA